MKKLGFGLMRLPVLDNTPEKIDKDQLCKMVDTFLNQGFTYFDTSFVYHNGESENAIRKALVERHDRESFLLASKLPTFIINKEEQVSEIFNQQLQKCGVEYFDYFLLHSVNSILYDTVIPDCHIIEYLMEQKKEGKIKHLGFSFHDSANVLDKILTEHPELEFVQLAINFYDWEASFIQARECYEVVRKHGKDVIIMEPVKGGMLAKLPEDTKEKLVEIDEKNKDMSDASFAIRFASGLEGVLVTLSGMSNIEQVEDNISYMKDFEPLTKEEKDALLSSVKAYQANGPVGVLDYSKYENITKNNMPVAGVLETYNSAMIQPNPYFAAEHNYYKGVRYQNKIDGSWIDGKIIDKDGNDITEKVKEAEDFLLKNSF